MHLSSLLKGAYQRGLAGDRVKEISLPKPMIPVMANARHVVRRVPRCTGETLDLRSEFTTNGWLDAWAARAGTTQEPLPSFQRKLEPTASLTMIGG
jgi:hypothetical protein